MTTQGQYIYAIVETDQDRSFGPMGIGGGKKEVYTVRHGDLGAVISDSPIVQYPVTRANTMAHQKVMEEVMKQFPLLPVRFGTVAEGVELIRERLLKEREEEFRDSLHYMRDKVELGLKAMWKNMALVFQEIVEKNTEIAGLRNRLLKQRGGAQRDQVRLGEMVKKALKARKTREQQTILDPLGGLWVKRKLNNPFGDQMITNAAFLVEKEKEERFDRAVEDMIAMSDGRMKFKYVGPIPPCNFVEIVVRW